METKIKFQAVSLILLFLSLTVMAFSLVNAIKEKLSFLEIIIILIIPVLFSVISFFLKSNVLKIVCFSLVLIFYITIFVLMMIPSV